MSNKGAIKIGNSSSETANAKVTFLKTKAEGSYQGNSDGLEVAMFEYISKTDNFVLKRQTYNVTGQSEEIMNVDKNGNVTFNTPVNFAGGSTTTSSTTTSIQEKKLELGLGSSLRVTAVAQTSATSTGYEITHERVVSDEPIGWGKCTASDNTTEFFPGTNGSSAVDHNLEIGDRIILTDSTNLTMIWELMEQAQLL